MKRLLFLPLFSFFSIGFSFAQSAPVDHYKTQTFNVAIFPAEYKLPIDSAYGRFTPTRKQVDSAERKFSAIIGNPHYIFYGADSIYMLRFFDKYMRRFWKDVTRQYFGVIDKSGNKVLWVNGFDKDGSHGIIDWVKEPIPSVLGGGWSVKYDLKHRRFYNPEDKQTVPCYPQVGEGIDHYKTVNFDAVIFPYNKVTLGDSTLKRFTPTEGDVDNIELQLRKQILDQKIDTNWYDSIKYTVLTDPEVHNNYSKYLKQYFGYIDSNGNKIIWLNCFWLPAAALDSEYYDLPYSWLKIPITTSSAGESAWNVKYNLTTCKFFDYVLGSTLDCYNFEGVYHYKTSEFDVAIFPKAIASFLGGIRRHKTFTPTKAEVAMAEKELRNDGKDSFVVSHLVNYKRQYYGYINKFGHKILYINCVCSSAVGGLYGWMTDWINRFEDGVCDGGECYWYVEYDMTTHKFFDFDVQNDGA